MRDGVGKTGVGRGRIDDGGKAQIVKGSQDVVAPVIWVGELQVLRIGDLAGGQAAKETSAQQIRLAATSCIARLCSRALPAFVFQQAFQDAYRRVE